MSWEWEERAAAAEARAAEGQARVKAVTDEAAAVKAEARARVEAAEAEVRATKSDGKAAVAAMKAEMVETERRIEAEQLASQRPILCAFVEQLLFSESFSDVMGKLTSLAAGKVVVQVLNEVVEDFLGLDKAYYRYELLEKDDFNCAYAEVLLEGLDSSHVLKTLSSSPKLLSVGAIRKCPADRDLDLGPIFTELVPEAGRESSEEEAGFMAGSSMAGLSTELPKTGDLHAISTERQADEEGL